MSAPPAAGAPERVFAVVVNWNGGAQNLDCVGSLLDQGLAAEQIVFVDNGSEDGSLAAVRAGFPDLVVLENGANLGFGEGANRGARAALERGADAVFYVNNDLVLPAGVLDRLVELLGERPRAGVIGPRVLYLEDPERVWCAGGEMTWRQNLSTLRGHGRRDGPEYRTNRPVDYVPGCAMLVRREVHEAIGFLDAGYFAYMEDVDFCLRAGAAGYEVLLAGEVAAHHAASSATGGGYNPRRKYMSGVNSVWFLRRHGTPRRWLRFLVFDVASLPFAWLVGLARGRGRAALAKGLGIWDGLRGRRVTAARIREGGGPLW